MEKVEELEGEEVVKSIGEDKVECEVGQNSDDEKQMEENTMEEVFENGGHLALRTPDILFQIFSLLDRPTLEMCGLVCRAWTAAAARPQLWSRLLSRAAARSPETRLALQEAGQAGPGPRALLRALARHTAHWAELPARETLLPCCPAAVNSQFGFSWDPRWWWGSQAGWVAAFALSPDGTRLVCGVIETLQVKKDRQSSQNKKINSTICCRCGMCRAAGAWRCWRRPGRTG